MDTRNVGRGFQLQTMESGDERTGMMELDRSLRRSAANETTVPVGDQRYARRVAGGSFVQAGFANERAKRAQDGAWY